MKTLVKWFIAGTFIVWIGFDVYLTQNGGPTESQVLREIGMRYTFFPFLIGFLSGHWFVTVKKPWASGWMYALPIILGLIAWDVFAPSDTWLRYPGIWLCLGIPSGALLWGQKA